jgi:hypothetical protein
MIVYDIINETAKIITIHPISKNNLDNRLKSGRWKDAKQV